jgi:hypothetical protein
MEGHVKADREPAGCDRQRLDKTFLESILKAMPV